MAAATSLLCGCSGARNETAGAREPGLLLEGSRVAGLSVRGRPIEKLILGDGADVALIIATIHGNENAGTALVVRLSEFLRERPSLLAGRSVVLMPVVNPDGYTSNIRTNMRGVDLNRNFGASNRRDNFRHGMMPLSEPESQTIKEVLDEHRPRRIISIHQPRSCVDFDGPAEALARAMSKYCELPVERIGSRAGSLGSYAGVDLGVPIITLELPRDADDLAVEDRWQKYGRALLASVTFPAEPPSLDMPRDVRIAWWSWAVMAVVAAAVVTVTLRLRKESVKEHTLT